jgi:hypothetical protein
MAKPKQVVDQTTAPTSFPNTTPLAVGTDIGGWLLNASTKMEGTLGSVEATLVALQTQMNRIESKLGEVEKEVAGHGKWMHTLKTFAVAMGILLGWVFANAVWPWAKAKLLQGGP